MISLAQFAATFTYVFIRGFQSQNVVGGKYHAAFWFSFMMVAAEVTSITLVVQVGWWSILPMGLGAAAGVLLSMYLYRATDEHGIIKTLKYALFTPK